MLDPPCSMLATRSSIRCSQHTTSPRSCSRDPKP